MKIDADLRAVIRSAEKAQPQRSFNYNEKTKAVENAIKAFMKANPKKASALKAAKKKYDKAKADKGAAESLINSFGLRTSLTDFWDKDNFKLSGGVLPKHVDPPWKYDDVVTELAAADPKNLKKILKKYDINWV